MASKRAPGCKTSGSYAACELPLTLTALPESHVQGNGEYGRLLPHICCGPVTCVRPCG
jgi:hypothetical protein